MYIHLISLGSVSYAEGLRAQERVVAARKAGTVGDTLLLMEHPPVLTLGRNSTRANILASDELLARKGVAVHEINRAGNMLDNVMYFHLRLERSMFDAELLERICSEAAGSVQLDQDAVVLRHLIVQRKIVPLPVYLETASESQIRTVIASLGACIRNNAATNIFNKDLDSRNYGVGQYGRVFLFDYDAVERLTDVKIRTNTDREPGEEDVPAWYFEDGIVFLPEEIEYGMQLSNDSARAWFRRENADLLTVRYWQDVQAKLVAGQIPELSMYPDRCRLQAAADPP